METQTHAHTQHTPPKIQTNNKTPLTKTSHARDTPTSKTNTPPATYHLLVEEHITEQMRRAKCKSLALESVPTARASSIESNVLELCKAVLHCQNLDKLCIRTAVVAISSDSFLTPQLPSSTWYPSLRQQDQLSVCMGVQLREVGARPEDGQVDLWGEDFDLQGC